MFGRRKKEKENQAMAALRAYQTKALKEIDKEFAEIESEKDIGKKIQKLVEFKSYIRYRSWDNDSYLDKAVAPRVKKFLRGWASQSVQERTLKKRLCEENPDLAAFETTRQAKAGQAAKMLKDIINPQNLAEIAGSAVYTEIYKKNESIRDLFTAHAAARAAIGDTPAPAQQEETPVSEPAESGVSRSSKYQVPRL